MGIRDEAFFNRVWESIVLPQMRRISDGGEIYCEDETRAHNRIQEYYNLLNEHVSANYMRLRDGELNRRKVASCFIYAICAAQPLEIPKEVWEREREMDGAHLLCFANERLAIVSGCSVLLSFFEHAVSCYADEIGLTPQQRQDLIGCLAGGIDLLEDVDGGDYLANLERALSLTVLEESYNVPILACMLAYWESRLLDPDDYRAVLGVIKRNSGI